MMKDIQLTKNFKLSEFLNLNEKAPPQEILDNIQRLATALQKVRDEIGKPIRITSGYRSREHNNAIGGAGSSYHVRGMAADIDVIGMTPAQVQKHLQNWPSGLGRYKTHTHVDIRSYKARWSK